MKLSDHERERNANFTSNIVNIMSAYVYVYENYTHDELKIPAIPLLYGIRNKKKFDDNPKTEKYETFSRAA